MPISYTAIESMPRRIGPDQALVGRQQEWAQLLAVWQAAANGTPQLALLTGDVGVGKTRLGEELLTWARRQGFPVATAVCYAAEGNLPFGPIVAWLRSRPLPVLPGHWRREVARLLHEAGGPDDYNAPWERHRLFEALAQAVLAWGRPPGKAGAGCEPLPILLMLDDLQWCDRDTLDWLHFLMRCDPHARLLILGTVQAGDIAADQSLAPLLNSLRRHGMVTEIELGPLSSNEILTLASQTAGRQLPQALAEPLYRGSEGNPLFVVEMIRAGIDHTGPWDAGHGQAALETDLPLPPKIQQVLRARLAQLSPAALSLAELAAVNGRACPYTVLARAFEGDESNLVQALDELWRRRILREAAGDSYDFTHDKLREVCYEGMSAARSGAPAPGRGAARLNSAPVEKVVRVAFTPSTPDGTRR
jgi:predicted ATPase